MNLSVFNSFKIRVWLFNVYMDGVVREVNVKCAWERVEAAE